MEDGPVSWVKLSLSRAVREPLVSARFTVRSLRVLGTNMYLHGQLYKLRFLAQTQNGYTLGQNISSAQLHVQIHLKYTLKYDGV